MSRPASEPPPTTLRYTATGAFADDGSGAPDFGPRRVDAGDGVGDRELRLLERELGAVVALAERLDLVRVRGDLRLDRDRLAALVVDRAGAGCPAGRRRDHGSEEHAEHGQHGDQTKVCCGSRVSRVVRLAGVADQGA